MEQEKQTATAGDTEKTLVSPRFDEEAISHARPAVLIDEADSLRQPPPSHLRQAASELTSSRLALVLVLISMLASGVIGALVAVIYQRNAAPDSPVAIINKTNDAPVDSAQTARDVTDEDALGEGVTRQRTAPVTETNTGTPVEPVGAEEASQASAQELEDQRTFLRAALDEWIATTNARDLNRQKEFYMPKVSAFYRARNVSRDEVLADKGRAFENADLLDVRALGQPDINIHPNGRMATMRFRKQYAVRNGQQDRRGEVVQELRWRRTGTGWKIVSERDVKVIQ